MPEHGKPSSGMCCLCTMEDITEDDGNYVEYQAFPSLKWYPCQFEQAVVQKLLDDQFEQYISRVEKTDCQAELKRLLEKGPPIYIHDKHGFPLQDNEEYVVKLWYASDCEERSSKLKGSKEGEEHQQLWDELNKFIVVEGKELGDDDNDGDANE